VLVGLFKIGEGVNVGYWVLVGLGSTVIVLWGVRKVMFFASAQESRSTAKRRNTIGKNLCAAFILFSMIP
jgi:hypothetical protein